MLDKMLLKFADNWAETRQQKVFHANAVLPTRERRIGLKYGYYLGRLDGRKEIVSEIQSLKKFLGDDKAVEIMERVIDKYLRR